MGCAGGRRTEDGVMEDDRADLTVSVGLVADGCLWSWEIIDARQGGIVQSGWLSDWTGYDSRSEALEAGRTRLAQLSSSYARP